MTSVGYLDPSAPALSLTGGLADIVLKLLKDASRAVESDRSAAKSCIARAFALVEAERDRLTLGPRADLSEKSRGGLAPWQMRRVTDYIEQHLDAPVRIRDLTELTQLSQSYFSIAFKQSFGEPAHAYLGRRRVVRAMEMMLTTEEPLSQIALACGLCDQAYLSRLFRKAKGVSPAAWRRQYRGAPREEILRALNAPMEMADAA